jgi:hypothetical protein
MKFKIIIFKTLIALIAVIGAIASVNATASFAASTGYVNYTTTTNATVRSYCAACSPHGTCDRPGSQPCIVTVTIIGQQNQPYNLKRLINIVCAVGQSDTDISVDCTITLPPTAILI